MINNLLHQANTLFSQSIIITFVVIMLMMLIEYINVKTEGKWLFVVKQKHYLQILLAAFLGWIPGCVGIFAIVSLYSHHMLTFGALFAAAVASFGDEAFFMMSFAPKNTAILSLILLSIAIVGGYAIDAIIGKKSLKSNTNSPIVHFDIHQENCKTHSHTHSYEKHSPKFHLYRLGIITLIVFFIIGITTGWLGHEHSFCNAFSHPHSHHNHWSGEKIIFLTISVLTLIVLIFSGQHFFEEHLLNHVVKKHFLKIFAWTIGILISLAAIEYFIDLENVMYNNYGPYILLLIAILIGIIPESGPHLIIFFLFLDGLIPFSTLIANSIVQEGHGGLPLLAERPKDFMYLKIIKIVLAFIIGIFGIIL